MTYELIDTGNGKKLERFGKHLLDRPCFQAIWEPKLSQKEWDAAEYCFSREGQNHWKKKGRDHSWGIEFETLQFKLVPTDFGHIGLFPEHARLWSWMKPHIQQGFELLNLFAYTGAATLAAARLGASVCHVDSSKKSVAWAKENAELNRFQDKPIRWIVEDAVKFVKREVKRGRQYNGIILDPPSFGRGAQGQVFKIETDLLPMLKECKELLEEKGKFLILSCHTPGISPLILENLLREVWGNVAFESGEMLIEGNERFVLPVGSFARWQRHGQ
ncbi:MAG: class I SAM-dependent methyltransferase [Simkaniaceae bacterium]|nr:class I SAM-dependent methyltransferase [Simkaniaceae bacterium]